MSTAATPAHTPAGTAATPLATLRQQLQQLQALHAEGALNDAAFQPAQAALQARIVERVLAGDTLPAATAATAAGVVDAAAASASTPASPSVARPALPRPLLAAVAAAVLVLAAGGYWWKGAPRLLAEAPANTAAPVGGAGGLPAGAHETGPAQIEAMVQRLEERLKTQPDDAEGWGMLARSHSVQGRHDQAVLAYRRAVALRPDDAMLLADFADTLAMTQQRQLKGEPLALVQRALKLAPDNLKALSLAGTAAFDGQDFKTAVKHWERVLAVAPAGSPYLERVQGSVAEAREKAGLPPLAPTFATTPAPSTAAAPATAQAFTAALAKPAATATDTAAATATATAPGPGVQGHLSISAGLRGQVSPEDTVFIFARAAEGPRMPLAIQRVKVKDLPLDFTLDDRHAMSPEMRLSAYPKVVVAARISASGNAMPQPGDVSVQAAPVAPGARGLKLTLERAAGAKP